jgi:hypothetical protein
MVMGGLVVQLLHAQLLHDRMNMHTHTPSQKYV